MFYPIISVDPNADHSRYFLQRRKLKPQLLGNAGHWPNLFSVSFLVHVHTKQAKATHSSSTSRAKARSSHAPQRPQSRLRKGLGLSGSTARRTNLSHHLRVCLTSSATPATLSEQPQKETRAAPSLCLHVPTEFNVLKKHPASRSVSRIQAILISLPQPKNNEATAKY